MTPWLSDALLFQVTVSSSYMLSEIDFEDETYLSMIDNVPTHLFSLLPSFALLIRSKMSSSSVKNVMGQLSFRYSGHLFKNQDV